MSHADGRHSPSFEVRVDSITTIADGVVELVLVDPHGDPLRPWEPGAHLDLHLPNGLVRQYSLTSETDDVSQYRVGILREQAGRGGSEFIHSGLRVGDMLTCDGPRNNFLFTPARGYRFIAGGIGITPLLRMLDSAEQAGATWKLTYCGRTLASMAWADKLQKRFPGRVDVRPDDLYGPPDLAAVLNDLDDEELVYACGPHGLLDALATHLGARAKKVLHVERFALADARTLLDGRQAFSVTLQRSGIELEVPENRTILDVMEERGIPVISSCREGTCGTCETAILAGEADHRDSILSDDEKAENETMMICCSRGIGTDLVIDA